jgi:hypothetical protein
MASGGSAMTSMKRTRDESRSPQKAALALKREAPFNQSP